MEIFRDFIRYERTTVQQRPLLDFDHMYTVRKSVSVNFAKVGTFHADFNPLYSLQHYKNKFMLKSRFLASIWCLICENWLRIDFRRAIFLIVFLIMT